METEQNPMPGRHTDPYHTYYGAYCRIVLTSGTTVEAIVRESRGPYIVTAAPGYAVRRDEIKEIKVLGR